MADHLILSLQAPPFLIFPSSRHRQWGFSRKFPGGVRFSVSEFRLSSQLQLANSTSSSSSSSPFPSPNSDPEKLDLVYSTQLKDGSHVFRFGDAREIEKYLETEEKARCVEVEKKQHAKIAAEATEFSSKGVKDLEKSDAKKKSVSSNTETDSEKEERAAPSNLSNVIKIKDRKRVRSPTKKRKETSTSVNVSQSQDNVEAIIASVSNLSSIVSVSEAIPTSSIEEKATVESTYNVAEAIPTSSTEEKVVNEITVESYDVEPLSSQVIENGSVNELGDCETNGYQPTTENRIEVQASTSSSTSQHVSQSTIEIDEKSDVSKNPIEIFEAEENLIVKPTATAAVSPCELISTSEATCRSSVDEIPQKPVSDTSEENTYEAEENIAVEPEATNRSVDEITEQPVIDTSEVENDRENVASTIEDEITLRDTKSDNGSISKTVNDTKGEDLQLPAPETASLEPIEVASGRDELVSKAFYLESGSASLQSPSKALTGREDAYFISDHNWIGIADGVSQWSFEGINKGTYAQELMSNCEKIISDETAKITDLVQVLHTSVNETKSPGSSTVLIAHLDNNELHVVNIGDSGFMVIRDGTVLQKSSSMFHHFGFPLQIALGDDVLKLAEVYHVNLEEGDVVITATDGLYDNLYEKEIVSIVCLSLEQSLEPQKIAELVAGKAQEVGGSERERTPFADAGKEEGYNGHKGGKLDAVTVIVSLVKIVST